MKDFNYPAIYANRPSCKQTKVKVGNYRIVLFTHTDGKDYFAIQERHKSKWHYLGYTENDKEIKAYTQYEHAFIVVAELLKQEV